MLVTNSAADSQAGAQPTPAQNTPEHGAPQLPPQRNSRLLDLIVLAVIAIVLLGGLGKAFADSDLFATTPAPAQGVEGCPASGCVKPPDEVCAGLPVKAIVEADGRQLYYAGDHPSYPGIIAIHVERGDRWFCTPAGAAAAGFAPAP
jgi:hypothetical protein